jgi:putative flippase GtrA
MSGEASVTSGSFQRSALSSLSATGSDFVVAAALAGVGAEAGAATFVGCVVGGLVAFTLNRAWAFRSHGKAKNELLRFFLVWGGSALLNAGGVSAIAKAGVPFGGSWLGVRVAVYLLWNYPLLRWFVFERRPA